MAMLRGPLQRAREFRQAANRLRVEIDVAKHNPDLQGLQGTHGAEMALGDLAEAFGVIAGIVADLDEMFPEGSKGREQFAQHLAFYRHYHRVPR